MSRKPNTVLKRLAPEAIIWIVSLIALAVYYPNNHGHFTLCPLRNLGFDFCPGCGLGGSISYLFHGEITNSLQAHPLGILAVIILTYRIVSLSIIQYQHYGKNN